MRKVRGFACQLLALASLLSVASAWGQTEQTVRPVTQTYALTNARVVQAPGRVLERATVLVRNGLIVAVGPNVAIPTDAKVLPADSMYVYAGFIDGHSNAGIPKPKEEERTRVKDPGNPPNDLAGIQPERSAASMLDAGEKGIEALRKAGFTAAHVVPHGKMLPGAGAIILLGGDTPDQMVLRKDVSMSAQLSSARGMYPATVIGVMAKFRDLYRKATYEKQHEALYAQNSTGIERPTLDRTLQAFYPIIDGRTPVAFKANRLLDVQRVLALRAELGFPLILAEVEEGWDAMEKIRLAKAGVFFTLNLPDDLGAKKEKKDEKTEEKEASAFVKEKEALEKRRTEAYMKALTQYAAYHKAGIPFGFSTMDAKAADLTKNLRLMVEKGGLDEQAALAALTTQPASMLGLSAMMGTVETGKMANLVVSTGPYFKDGSQVRYVMVEGVLHEYEVKAKKTETAKDKDDKEAPEKVKINGKWSYTTESAMGNGSGLISLKDEGGRISGTMTSNFMPEPIELTDIEVDGPNVSFVYPLQMQGQSFNLKISIKISGDSFTGSMDTGRFGVLPMEGEREPDQR